MLQKPSPNEYAPYFETYFKILSDEDFLTLFQHQNQHLQNLLSSISELSANFVYAEGKWSIKSLWIHVLDIERVMSYRAFIAARKDTQTVLQPMNDEAYLRAAEVENRTWQSVLKEYFAHRNSVQCFFETLTDEQSCFPIMLGEHSITARAAAYILLGHTQWHTQILEERYLPFL